MRRSIVPRGPSSELRLETWAFPLALGGPCRQSSSGCNPISVFLLTWTQPTTRLVWLDGLMLERRWAVTLP